jgi:hypothetical protein
MNVQSQVSWFVHHKISPTRPTLNISTLLTSGGDCQRR